MTFFTIAQRYSCRINRSGDSRKAGKHLNQVLLEASSSSSSILFGLEGDGIFERSGVVLAILNIAYIQLDRKCERLRHLATVAHGWTRLHDQRDSSRATRQRFRSWHPSQRPSRSVMCPQEVTLKRYTKGLSMDLGA